jgi:hypothetical protein
LAKEHRGLQARIEELAQKSTEGEVQAKETVETVLNNVECFPPGLKPGVNERAFEGSKRQDATALTQE